MRPREPRASKCQVRLLDQRGVAFAGRVITGMDCERPAGVGIGQEWIARWKGVLRLADVLVAVDRPGNKLNWKERVTGTSGSWERGPLPRWCWRKGNGLDQRERVM